MVDQLRVRVVGDSVMWGQGLRHNDKFAVIALRRVAEMRGQEVVFEGSSEEFTARSGAKILASENLEAGEPAIMVGLPSGTTRAVPLGDRTDFYDRYPALFAE